MTGAPSRIACSVVASGDVPADLGRLPMLDDVVAEREVGSLVLVALAADQVGVRKLWRKGFSSSSSATATWSVDPFSERKRGLRSLSFFIPSRRPALVLPSLNLFPPSFNFFVSHAHQARRCRDRSTCSAEVRGRSSQG